MSKIPQTKSKRRQRRHARVRAVVSGTSSRPRLHVGRSLKGLYVQLIDDTSGKTIVSVNSKKDAGKGDAGERTGKVAVAYLLGKVIAEKAQQEKISTVVFDRGGNAYHGRVQAVAEGARDGGLKF